MRSAVSRRIIHSLTLSAQALCVSLVLSVTLPVPRTGKVKIGQQHDGVSCVTSSINCKIHVFHLRQRNLAAAHIDCVPAVDGRSQISKYQAFLSG